MAKKYLNNDELDFLQSESDSTEQHKVVTPRPKRSRKKGLILFFALAAFILSSFLYVQASASPLTQGLETLPWIQSLKKLIGNDEDFLVGEDLDAINILLIGMGGEGHDGAYLADTIMVARFKPSTKEIALISFPRDLAVNMPGYGWRKINNAHAFGGPEMIQQMVSEIIGEEVAYYVSIDFSGFEDVIDDLGGIDIYVEQSFTDYEYPAANHEIQTVHFDQGMQHMDGSRALIYARSRHGNNGEAGDFARSARQQKILFAIQEKATSANTLFNPTKLVALYNNFTKYVDTNIEPAQVVRFAQLSQGMRASNVETVVLTDGPLGLLEPTIGDSGAYLLIPKAGLGNFSEIQTLVAGLFAPADPVDESTSDTASTSDAQPEPVVVPERPTVIVLNGTALPGFAGGVSDVLAAENFDVRAIANHTAQNLTETIVYDLHEDDNPNSHDFLDDYLTFDRESKLDNDLRDYLNQITSQDLTQIDFIIILGLDNQSVL